MPKVIKTLNIKEPSDWLLASGYYVPAKWEMVIAHPRPENETNSFARYRNAYPSVKYTCPININGGAYPFKYELTTAPAGMTIGSVLVESDDVLVPPSDYGIITWNSPTTGSHDVAVRVTDQDGVIKTVSWTLVVGTSNWLFIATDGNDSTGDGSIGNPWATTAALHNNLGTSADYDTDGPSVGKLIYYREGTHNLVGMTDANGNYRMQNDHVAVVHLGYPGESVTMHMDSGHFFGQNVITGQKDIFIGDMTLEHDETLYGTNQSFLRISAQCANASIFNCTLKDYQRGDGTENSAAFSVIGASAINYPCMSHCTVTGQSGVLFTEYDSYYAVIEHMNGDSVTSWSSMHADNFAVVILKDNPHYVTVRCFHANTPTAPLLAGQATCFFACYVQGDLQHVEFSYSTVCVLEHSNPGDIGTFSDFRFGSGTPIDDYHWYRNSVKGEWKLTKLAAYHPTNWSHTHNVCEGFTMPTDADLTSENNLDGVVTYFDSSLKLTGTYRTNNLGTHGAEIKPVYR